MISAVFDILAIYYLLFSCKHQVLQTKFHSVWHLFNYLFQNYTSSEGPLLLNCQLLRNMLHYFLYIVFKFKWLHGLILNVLVYLLNVCDDVSDESRAELTFQHTVANISKLKETSLSGVHMVRNLPWFVPGRLMLGLIIVRVWSRTML